MKEYVGSPVLQTCVFSFLLHVYQRHVGVQKLLFFSKLPAAMRDSDSGLSPPSLSPTAHNKTIWLLRAPSYLWLYPKTLKCHVELKNELSVILQFPI